MLDMDRFLDIDMKKIFGDFCLLTIFVQNKKYWKINIAHNEISERIQRQFYIRSIVSIVLRFHSSKRSTNRINTYFFSIVNLSEHCERITVSCMPTKLDYAQRVYSQNS